MRGLFISLEGIDGSGKSTALTTVLERLKKRYKELTFVQSREPGGNLIAEAIREIILNPDYKAMDARTEALLYAASRRQHLVENLLPQLDQGKVVICDRFIDSSLAYQGYARSLGIYNVLIINRFATEGLLPDLTLYFDIDPVLGMERVKGRGKKDRLEEEGYSFQQAVRKGYLEVVDKYPERIVVIDASRNVEEVAKVVEEKLIQAIDCHYGKGE